MLSLGSSPMVSPGCRLRLHFDVLDSQNICKVHLFWLHKASILTADYVFGFETLFIADLGVFHS